MLPVEQYSAGKLQKVFSSEFLLKRKKWGHVNSDYLVAVQFDFKVFNFMICTFHSTAGYCA